MTKKTAKRRTSQIAGLIITESERPHHVGLTWQTAWQLVEVFGVDPESQWTMKSALAHCMQVDQPCPSVTYSFEKHALLVRNGCMLVRPVKLLLLPEVKTA